MKYALTIFIGLLIATPAEATITTFYPDPNVESTSVDCDFSKENATYSTAQSAASSDGANDALDYAYIQNTQDGIFYIRRYISLFDTSSIPDTDTVSAATYSLFDYLSHDSYGDTNNDSLEVVSSNPASNTSCVVGDYSTLGTTSFGSLDITSFPSNAYGDWTLNASGLATITATGVTKMGLRTAQDIAATSPSGLNRIRIRTADYAGTTSDPKLVVTHAAAAAPAASTDSIIWSMF